MIQIIAKLEKYLVIYWVWVDCTISITIEKFDSYDFTKKFKQFFHSKWTYIRWNTKLFKNLLSFAKEQELCWRSLIRIHFICLSKHYMIYFLKYSQNNTKCTPQKKHFSCPKWSSYCAFTWNNPIKKLNNEKNTYIHTMNCFI